MQVPIYEEDWLMAQVSRLAAALARQLTGQKTEDEQEDEGLDPDDLEHELGIPLAMCATMAPAALLGLFPLEDPGARRRGLAVATLLAARGDGAARTRAAALLDHLATAEEAPRELAALRDALAQGR